MKKLTLASLPLLAASLLAVSCGGGEAEHGDDHGHGHAHDAQFGGTVVPLGDHFANLEVVHDGETGSLRIFTMGAHNEKTVPSSTESVTVTVEAGEAKFDLELAANVSESMGNEVGASALFEVTDERLVGVESAHLEIGSIEVRGETWEDVEVHLGHDHDHGHDGEGHGDEAEAEGEDS